MLILATAPSGVLAASFLTIIGALALVTVMFLIGILLGFMISRRQHS